MRCLAMTVLVGGALGFTTAASAQPLDVGQLRDQINALEQQLADLERSPLKNQRVTQLGGTRIRGRDPSLVVRIYDLSDMFALAPVYVATRDSDLSQDQTPLFPLPGSGYSGSGLGGLGGFGGGGGGFFSVDDRPRQFTEKSQQVLYQTDGGGSPRATMTDLIAAITATIAPDTWEDAGGPATIAQLGTAVIISTDPSTHEQIDDLLQLFRRRWGTLRTVSVQAWWLWLTDAQLAGLLSDAGEAGEDEVKAFGLVEEDAWKMHLAGLGGEEGGPAGYRAAVTCYNGQTVHTVAGSESLAVTDVRPVITRSDNDEREGRVAYRPQVSLIHEGAALQVTPGSNYSGKTVILDVHSRVTQRLEADRPAAAAAEGAAGGGEPTPRQVVAAIDRPRLVSQRISTSLRIPVDRVMLVGGMTFAGVPQADGSELYLFVKTAVQELRNDQDADADDPQPAVEPGADPPATDDAGR